MIRGLKECRVAILCPISVAELVFRPKTNWMKEILCPQKEGSATPWQVPLVMSSQKEPTAIYLVTMHWEQGNTTYFEDCWIQGTCWHLCLRTWSINDNCLLEWECIEMKQKCPVHRRSTGSTDPSVGPLMGTFFGTWYNPNIDFLAKQGSK